MLAEERAAFPAGRKPGKHSDGGNLYLIVSDTGSRKWVLRFTWRGAAKEMGLGSANDVPLADAREKAADARRTLAKGLNPLTNASGTVAFRHSEKWPISFAKPWPLAFATKSTRRNGG